MPAIYNPREKKKGTGVSQVPPVLHSNEVTFPIGISHTRLQGWLFIFKLLERKQTKNKVTKQREKGNLPKILELLSEANSKFKNRFMKLSRKLGENSMSTC